MIEMFLSPFSDLLVKNDDEDDDFKFTTIFKRPYHKDNDKTNGDEEEEKIVITSRLCSEQDWQNVLEECRLRSRLEGSECVPEWRGSPRMYVNIINNDDVVVSSIDACQIQSVYNAERNYLASIDCVENRRQCVRGDLQLLVVDPHWSVYRIMFCPSMKEAGRFDEIYVTQQLRRSSKSWTWLHHREIFMRVMSLKEGFLRNCLADVALRFCRHHRREAYYAMQFGDHEHSKDLRLRYCNKHPLVMCDVAGLNAIHYAAFEGDVDGVYSMLKEIERSDCLKGSTLIELRHELGAISLEMRSRCGGDDLAATLLGDVSLCKNSNMMMVGVCSSSPSWKQKMEARWISPLVLDVNKEEVFRLRQCLGALFGWDELVKCFS